MIHTSSDSVQAPTPFLPGENGPSTSEPGAAAPCVIRFPQGLPGFPHASRFSLHPLRGKAGLLLLVSTDDPTLRFLVIPHVEGRLPLARGDIATACATLGMAHEGLAILLVVSAQVARNAAPSQLYVNLRAPIFIDTIQCSAVQHVLPCPSYPVRYPLAAHDLLGDAARPV